MWDKRKFCRICDNPTSQLFAFGQVPYITSNNRAETKNRSFANASASLTLMYCGQCCHLQLEEVVQPNLLYASFSYESKYTQGLLDHFEQIVSFIIERLQISAPVVIEAGSNTGSFLRHCQRAGASVIGIEPSKALADRANLDGLRTLHGYFNAETSEAAVSIVGHADCFYVANTLANVDDLHEFLSAASNSLKPDGILLVDTQDGEAVIDHFLIDTIYHEHLNYFTEYSLSRLAEQHGLLLEQTIRHPSKGGAMLCVFSKFSTQASAVTNPQNFLDRLSAFGENVRGIKKKVRNRLRNDSTILAFGSSVGCAMLSSFFCLDERVLAVLDDNPQIDAILTDRGPIQVVPTSEVVTYTADTIILLAHRYEATIRKSLSIAGLKDPAVIFNPWKH